MPNFGNQIYLAHHSVSQVEVSKVLEVRDGAEGLTESILETKLLS